MTAVAAEIYQPELIDLSKLEVHPANPRRDVGDISDITASIKDVGLLAPLLAVKHNGKYQVVDGSRRLAALKKAGKTQASVRVLEASEAEAASIAIISNLQRKDLEPLEEAGAYRQWLNYNPGKTQKELAEKVGRAPSTVANALRLLDAPKLVQEALRTQTIGAEHARVVLSVPAEVASALTLKKGITVEQLRTEAADLTKSYEQIKKLKDAVAEAKAGGKTVAWPDTQMAWFGRQHMKLGEGLGNSPDRVVDVISGEHLQIAGTYGLKGDVALHDKVCACRASGPVDTGFGEGFRIQRVCINAPGWRKYAAALKKAAPKSRVYGSTARQKKQTPAQRESARKAKEKRADAEAAGALEVHIDIPASANDRRRGRAAKLDAKYLKGGPAGENGRLALFAMTARDIWNADGGRAALWKRIERMSIAKVRELVAKHAAARSLEFIGSRKDERELLTSLVSAHYGVKLPEPKAKARKKTKSKKAKVKR